MPQRTVISEMESWDCRSDRKTLIHVGASLNYLGKKCFAVSTFDPLGIPELIAKLPV